MLWIQEKNFLPRAALGCRAFLKSHRKEGEECFLELCFYHRRRRGFDSRETIVKYIWTHVKSLPWQIGLGVLPQSKCTMCSAEPFLHFTEEQKGITELFSPCSHPVASDRLQRARCSAGTHPQLWAAPSSPCPTQTPPGLAVGTQIPTEGGVAHVRSSHCVMSATQSANASGWILAWTLQREAKIRACNMEICNILCTWVAQSIPSQML